MNKSIRLTAHAAEYKLKRGFTDAEVVDAIKTSSWQPAELNRLQCEKNFEFKSEWNDVYFQTKQIKPIFVDEANEIVVITVYTYYF
ncbi:MAG: hypothetical protein ABIQ74_03875 [Chitinophagales bacterium]